MKEKLEDQVGVNPDNPLKINYDPDTQENIVQRAAKLKEIVEQLDKAQIVPQAILLREFDV